HGSSPYPLPVDTPEQERMNATHYALFTLLGGHYPTSCPASEALAMDPERQPYALDLCTGTGRWTMDVAQDFPHVAFRGLDIVPISTRYPHPNVQFSIHDVNTPTVWGDATFDFIHARSVTMAVTSYPALLTEVARLLRPRGLFLSGEWGRYPGFHPACTPATDTPALTAFFAHLHGALMARGLPPVAPPVAPLLAQSGAFDEIAVREYHMPIGTWHPEPAMKALGRTFRAAYLRYMNSARPMLEESGVSAEELDDVYVRAEREVCGSEGLIAVFHTVHAKKI
ncbi:S-adenosyl-L-methionine-dependent methyltransferase, partial [Mycena vitilis]